MSTNVVTDPPPPLLSVVQFIDGEIHDYEMKVGNFRAGVMPEDDFMAFRVRLGVYGQRQPTAHMLRVKIPGGLIHADQLDGLAEIVEKYATFGRGHLTTRENVQIYQMSLEDAAESMNILRRVGLTTKEAAGNTVRNVVACPMAGLDPRQAFDIQPYMGAFVRNFTRRDFTFHMPRKIKAAFSCGEHDCGVTAIHDLGFIARVREEGGVPKKGFKIVVGGGTSIQPLQAETLYEFVPVEDFLRVSEALLRVFNRTAWLRRNKMKARIKVLIHAEGIDSFRAAVEKELQEEWAQDYGTGEDLLFHDTERNDALEIPQGLESQGERDTEFRDWRRTNVVSQTEDGYSFVSVTVPRGDMTPEQFRGIARIARQYASSRVRATPEQNLLFRWTPNSYLYDVYQELHAIGLAQGGVNGITDVTSCPGTDSCKMAITSAMGLNRAVVLALKDAEGANAGLLDDPLIQGIHVKMSGCPNGCGRHHVADIGFHGAFIKGPGGGQIPAYEMFLGGSYEEGDVRYGVRPRGKVPAKRVTEAVFHILHLYRNERNNGEVFRDFAARVGREPFEKIIADFATVGPLNKANLDLYMDYEKTKLYVMERGEGECSV